MTKKQYLKELMAYYKESITWISTMTARRDGTYDQVITELEATFKRLLGLED